MTRLLNRLDERIIPGLGRALRRSGRAAVASAGLGGRRGRFAAAALRRHSVAIAAVVLLAIAAVLITLTGGDQKAAVRPKVSTVVPPLTGQQLGPVAGTTVASYLDAAALRRQQLSSLPATQPVTAVVDLTGYLTPQAIGALLASHHTVTLVRGFARVPPPAAAPIHVLTADSGAALSRGLSAAQSAAATAERQYALYRTLERRHPSVRLQVAIRVNASRAARARVDQHGLSPSCGCVFAVVVTGPVGDIEKLANLVDVRVLDPAPVTSSLQQLAVVPLEPQVTGVVRQLEYAGE